MEHSESRLIHLFQKQTYFEARLSCEQSGMKLYQTFSLPEVLAISNVTSEFYTSGSFFVNGRIINGCATLVKLKGIYRYLSGDCEAEKFYICEYLKKTCKQR
jgi:hypothetical protein